MALALAGAVGWRLWRPPAKPSAPAAVAAAPQSPEGLRRTFAIARVQDLASALVAEGVGMDRAIRLGLAANEKLDAAPGELRVSLRFRSGQPGLVDSVELRRADGSGVRLRGDGSRAVDAEPLSSNRTVEIKVVRGEMDANSFYSSAVAAGVRDSLIDDFAAAFAFDFDFQREIKPGDIFEAAFERQVDAEGAVVGSERLVYVSLQTSAKSRALYAFQPPGDARPSWFDGNGVSVVRGLMRTPVEGARITSSFGLRVHPVLGYTRLHKGTDFAVPVGTAVYASGDGVVDFVGPHGGHGNFVRIRHKANLETAYAHLSRFAPGVVVGTAVRQGQPIAFSGNTGLSSGPHLHYEVIVEGVQVDPMSFQTSQGRTLNGQALAAFRRERDRIDGLRAAQNG
ncbi:MULTISPECIES: M23 family metallopeptidase [unclassified Caulobacter]|uniref:M23 family metallopeptidase n=1 Tax=unclassified Caulobacter TaxID=2648921 RepID=UPI00138F1D95|nr:MULTISPECIES: M23 family metallopeptidase [unclassified Caulobacter]